MISDRTGRPDDRTGRPDGHGWYVRMVDDFFFLDLITHDHPKLFYDVFYGIRSWKITKCSGLFESLPRHKAYHR